MNKRRLLKLADKLDTVPAARFCMNHWYQGEGSTLDLPTCDIGECGTAACALGWATTIPAFKRAGLTMRRGELYGVWKPEFEHRKGFCAAADFFGITEDEAWHLFMARAKRSGGSVNERPTTVAKRIRRFVEKGGAPQ